MPAHEGVLDDARIHLVAAYVLSLSEGAKAASTSTAAGQ
jgi:mono/diheme cytochrome c family protein